MYYKICEYCGAYLDPGEKCDCKKAAASHATIDKQIKNALHKLPHPQSVYKHTT